jgi:lipopolysaccharide transport system permease protein
MGTSAGLPKAPTTVITPRRGWFHLGLGELWRYRELGYFLVWRDIKVRYKQTVIGATWAIIQPVVLMIVFTAIFGRGGGRLSPPEGIPGPIFYFSALLVWTYFSQALQGATASIVTSQNVITKIYFPRLVLPISGTLPGVVDLLMSFLVMSALMLWYGFPFTLRLLVIPALVLLAALTALGAGLWLAASNALYRDIREGTPFLIQVLMFLSVILPAKGAAVESIRWLLAFNPMTAVIEGCRWAILGPAWGHAFPTDLLGPGIAVACLLFVTGLIYFRRIEDVIVDVV